MRIATMSALLLFAGWVLTSCSGPRHETPGAHLATSLPEATALAAEENRFILVEFWRHG